MKRLILLLCLPVGILMAQALRSFNQAAPLETVSETTANASIGDLNGDGTLDMAISNDRPDPKIVLLNDGNGRLDIVACHEEEGLFIYFNTGKGNFGPGFKLAGKEALPSMLARS